MDSIRKGLKLARAKFGMDRLNLKRIGVWKESLGTVLNCTGTADYYLRMKR